MFPAHPLTNILILPIGNLEEAASKGFLAHSVTCQVWRFLELMGAVNSRRSKIPEQQCARKLLLLSESTSHHHKPEQNEHSSDAIHCGPEVSPKVARRTIRRLNLPGSYLLVLDLFRMAALREPQATGEPPFGAQTLPAPRTPNCSAAALRWTPTPPTPRSFAAWPTTKCTENNLVARVRGDS